MYKSVKEKKMKKFLILSICLMVGIATMCATPGEVLKEKYPEQYNLLIGKQWVLYDVNKPDVYGKIEQGPIIGDNLSTAIYAKSGNGVVHDAAVRDLEGIKELQDFTSFVRGWHPSYASPTIMLMGVNTPVRIGHATVMPGDVVLGKNGGVIFIPPHLGEKVVKTSELIRLRDAFGKLRLRERKYTPGQIDARWTDEIERDFSHWLQDHIDELPVPKEAIQELLKERTW